MKVKRKRPFDFSGPEWESMHMQRSYRRRFGPISMEVVFRIFDSTYCVSICVVGAGNLAVIDHKFKPPRDWEVGDVLRHFEKIAKKTIASWAK